MGTAPATKMVIPSCLAEASAVQQALLNQLAEHDYPEKAIFAVRLALDEALTNAIRHGNDGDPSKKVTVEWTITPQKLTVTITDEGYGFQPCNLPDPTAEENLTRPCGRGVMLMQAYMSDVTFNQRGNKVTMTKLRDCLGPGGQE